MKIPLHKSLLFIHDIIIIIGGIIISHYIYFHHRFLNYSEISYGHFWGYVILFFSGLVFLQGNHLYKYQIILDRSRHTLALLKSLVTSLIVLIFISFIFKITEVTMRYIIPKRHFSVFRNSEELVYLSSLQSELQELIL